MSNKPYQLVATQGQGQVTLGRFRTRSQLVEKWLSIWGEPCSIGAVWVHKGQEIPITHEMPKPKLRYEVGLKVERGYFIVRKFTSKRALLAWWHKEWFPFIKFPSERIGIQVYHVEDVSYPNIIHEMPIPRYKYELWYGLAPTRLKSFSNKRLAMKALRAESRCILIELIKNGTDYKVIGESK